MLVQATIGSDGTVVGAEVLQGIDELRDAAALAAVLAWRFTPARRDGAPIRARVKVPVTFQPRTADAAEQTAEGVGPTAGAATDDTAARVPPPRRQPSEDDEVEVIVSAPSEAETLRKSARAVHVVELEPAKTRSADLGEVLAREQGVGVRRSGGLGSGTRFSLNGLTDDQIRFFLDGVPLELLGYPFGVANVPLNLVDRVEIYRGVVPIRFGADALGGAVHLVSSDDLSGTHGAASWQAGSFGTHRLTLTARHRHARSGFFVRSAAFFDHADNDYRVNVQVPDPRPEFRGQLVDARAYRFHDGYVAGGANVEVGFADTRWAKRFVVRGFANEYGRELQNNPTMEIPYGDVRFGELGAGVNVRYQHVVRDRVEIDVVAGHAYTRTDFLDVGTCVYDWFGRCIRQRQAPGEIDEGNPRDDTLHEQAGYLRATVGWRIAPGHVLRATSAPTFVFRDGEDRILSFGPLTANRRLLSAVHGIEYQLDIVSDRLQNFLFAKSYVQGARSNEPVIEGVERTLDRSVARFGAGDSLRFRVRDGLDLKGSYEYATRLPNADEVFGDAILTNENLDLKPEVSHNANLGLTLDLPDTRAGAFRGEVNLFLRQAQNLIVRLPAFGERFRNENLFEARSLGVEASAGWTSRGDYLSLDGNVTWFDLRNLGDRGPFAQFDGDRVPNRPFLFTNAFAQLQTPPLVSNRGWLALLWNTRFVHEFFEFWESAGTSDSKRTIPSQLIHTVGLAYRVRRASRALSFSGEVTNLTDAPAFDYFGVQRPGRAVFFKTTAEF